MTKQKRTTCALVFMFLVIVAQSWLILSALNAIMNNMDSIAENEMSCDQLKEVAFASKEAIGALDESVTLVMDQAVEEATFGVDVAQAISVLRANQQQLAGQAKMLMDNQQVIADKLVQLMNLEKERQEARRNFRAQVQ